MELNTKKQTHSKDLLSCGNGGGLHDTFLLKPKTSKPFQTERVPRSSVLDRLHSFLPAMAAANHKLKEQIEESSTDHFDIENVEEAERVIEMDVALVELSSSEEEAEEEDTSEEDSEEEREVTEENLKLPGDNKRRKKANIQVMDKQAQ